MVKLATTKPIESQPTPHENTFDKGTFNLQFETTNVANWNSNPCNGRLEKAWKSGIGITFQSWLSLQPWFVKQLDFAKADNKIVGGDYVEWWWVKNVRLLGANDTLQ